MSREVELDGAAAMRQAGMTADDYLMKAFRILEGEYNQKQWTI